MERLLKEELDKMTCGEVALRVFGAERELDELFTKRAEAYHRLGQIEQELERAKNEVGEACRNETEASRELSEVKKYLSERLHIA
jgi:chromosome segregation ATPase